MDDHKPAIPGTMRYSPNCWRNPPAHHPPSLLDFERRTAEWDKIPAELQEALGTLARLLELPHRANARRNIPNLSWTDRALG
jgi:hypothetical protein